MSLKAKVREESIWLGAGGGVWGKGRSSKRSIKAPKSGFCVIARRLLRRVSARTMIPATPIPTTNHSLGLEACSFTSFKDLDMIDQERERKRVAGFWKGFRKRVAGSQLSWIRNFQWRERNSTAVYCVFIWILDIFQRITIYFPHLIFYIKTKKFNLNQFI